MLTVTSLVHEVMPLVRYFTGDMVRLDPRRARAARRADGRGARAASDVIEIGGGRATPYEMLDAGYEFADRSARASSSSWSCAAHSHLLIEVDDRQRPASAGAERRLAERIGVPVVVEYLGHNEVLDRSALYRGPKIYKPRQVSDWRGEAARRSRSWRRCSNGRASTSHHVPPRPSPDPQRAAAEAADHIGS